LSDPTNAEILRFAQNDSLRAFFINLFEERIISNQADPDRRQIEGEMANDDETSRR